MRQKHFEAMVFERLGNKRGVVNPLNNLGTIYLKRREVRAARVVVSPNVCRIFDLIEVEGRELVSMEYVDGGTLLALLQERGPLELKEAQDIASQFLAGLEAIHQAGLVHRDVKPENIMITRAGRVVLMDFGLARQEDSGAGSVAGTPASSRSSAASSTSSCWSTPAVRCSVCLSATPASGPWPVWPPPGGPEPA